MRLGEVSSYNRRESIEPQTFYHNALRLHHKSNRNALRLSYKSNHNALRAVFLAMCFSFQSVKVSQFLLGNS